MEEKRGRGRPKKIDPTDQNEIEDLLAQLPSDYRVMIDRIEPEYCHGYLGKFFIGAGTGVSMDEIKRRWGGRVFKLRIFDEKGKLAKTRTISIDEQPRREGKLIRPDGTTEDYDTKKTESNDIKKTDVFAQIINSNLPDHLKQMYLSHMTGAPVFGGFQQREPEKDLHVYQLISDMMSSNRESQNAMAKANLELMDSIFEMKRKNMAASAPADPINQLNQTIELVRAMNGVQSELRPQGESNVTSQLIDTSIPMLQNAFSEYIQYKKAAMQLELQKNIAIQNNKPPMPHRIAPTNDMPRISSGTASTPIDQAREMAKLFRTMSPEDQSAVMSEFFATLENENFDDDDENDDNNMENIEPGQNFDTMENIDVLPAEDRAILNAHGGASIDHEIETGHVSNGNGTGTIENNDSIDREGNSGRFEIPAD